MLKRVVLLTIAVPLLIAAAPADAQPRLAGKLTCPVPRGLDLFSVRTTVECALAPTGAGADERYIVTVPPPFRPVIPDEPKPPFAIIPVPAMVDWVWDVYVFEISAPGLLAGGYAPAAPGDPAAAGLGNNVLIGGVGNQIALRPAPGTTSFVAGVTLLELQLVP